MAEEIRYARGRRPFLCKKVVGGNAEGATECGEESRGKEDSFEDRSKRVHDWLRSNPLHLGMSDESVELVKKMLYQGSKIESRREKCWKHICIELADVPGSPITVEEAEATHLHVEQAQSASLTIERPDSPETTEDAGVPPLLPRVSSKNNDEFTPRDAIESKVVAEEKEESESRKAQSLMESDQTDSLKNLEVETEERKTTPPQRKKRDSVPLPRKKTCLKKNGSKAPIERRKTDSNLLRNAASSVVNTDLLNMSLMERQEYTLKRKQDKAVALRAMADEKEIEGCTHKPHVFTRRSFSNVESVIKKQTSPSPFSGSEKFAFGTSPKNAAASPSTFLEECKHLMAANRIGGAESNEPAKKNSSGKKKKAITRRKSKNKLLEEQLSSSSLLVACKEDLDKAKAEQEAKEAEALRLKEREEQRLREEEEQRQREEEEEKAKAAEEEARRKAALPEYCFAENSTASKGKIQLQDCNHFQLDSFYRKRDRGSSKPGVSLLMGRRDDDFTEQVVAVVFDRNKFTEKEASDWMHRNCHRFPTGRRELLRK